MTELKKKIIMALCSVALVAGAIPGTMGLASAYENPNGGQHFDRGRFPRTIHIVALTAVTVTILGIVFAVRERKATPTSP